MHYSYANASSMQTEHFLRLTAEFLSGFQQYPHDDLTSVLNLLGTLDRAWLTLLRGEQWSPKGQPGPGPSLSSVTQTQRIRLRALCIHWQEVIFEASRSHPANPDEDDEDSDSDLEEVVVTASTLHSSPQPLYQNLVFPLTLARLQRDIDIS